MDKHALRQKILQLEGLTHEEKSALLELLQKQKRYGLVWEEKPEEVEERLRNSLPILREVKERAILSDSPDSPNHILIEGDNLEALTALSYTHAGKIDVIYIDPPYNTGNRDFVYNDSFVDSEDSFRHSKWLSFMSKRLKIAKRLLSDKGVIFISIGDEEVAQLKLLCDSIFDVIALVPRIAKKGSDQGTHFRPTKDYIVVCAKFITNVLGFVDSNIREVKEYDLVDENTGRKFRKGHSLYQASLDPLRGCKNQRYFIEAPDGSLVIPPGENMPVLKIDGDKVVPQTRNDKVWRWSVESYLNKKEHIMFCKSKRSPLIDSEGLHTDWNVYEIKYQDEEEAEITTLPNDFISDYPNSMGTTLLNKMKISFSFSKPVELVKYLLEIIDANAPQVVLDFFAGSGTTLHATMQLNAEDGGHRQCILVTNNENNICEEVTYVRNKRVINGYTTPRGEKVEGLKNNSLRYYKTEMLPRTRSPRNMRALMAAATDLLCVKEDLYEECMNFGQLKTHPRALRYFEKDNRRMLVLYNEELTERIVEEIKTMDFGGKKLKIYIFSPDRYAFDDNFIEVQDKVQLVALPSAIYDAYQRVLPKQPDRLLTTPTTETADAPETTAQQEIVQTTLKFDE